MPFPWKAVAAGGLTLGVVAAIARALNKPSAPHVEKRVALIGDSYAVGLGPELDLLFPHFKFEGHVGTNTSQWASHAKACGQCGDWITAFHPDVVLVSLGVNDDPVNRSNYQTIVSGLHGIGARVIWIEPPAGVKTPSIDAVRKAIISLGVPIVPAPTFSLRDGLHPTPDGYAAWAAAISQEVSSG